MSTGFHKRIAEATEILASLGLPRGQQNERLALCLLALLDLRPRKSWGRAESPLVGIAPIMEWVREHYKKAYAPNTRETVRRQTIHQLVDAGIVLRNPDDPVRPVNSPQTVYQIEPKALELLRSFGAKTWSNRLAEYLACRETLAAKYAKYHEGRRIPVRIVRWEENCVKSRKTQQTYSRCD